MDSTFSIDVPAPQTAPSLQAQPVKVGVEGAAQEATLQLTQQGNGFDMGPLMKLGQDLLEPIIKQQQQAAFYAGVSRAARGETAADIDAERPAWARMFGDSMAVQGARYHEQVSDAAALERRVIESLPTSRAIPPEEFAQHLRKNMEALKTGDPVRDMILEGSALQFMPGAIKMHSRAHLDFKQKEAAAQVEQSTQQIIGGVETMAQQQRDYPATQDDEAMQNILFRSTSILQVPPGVNEDEHMARISNGLRGALSQGQFTTYNFWKQQGLLDKLPLATRDSLSQLADSSARKFVQEKTPEDGRIAAFNLTNNFTEYDGPTLLKAIDTLNAQIRAKTGIPADFIPQTTKDNLLQMRENWRNTNAKAALTADQARAKREADIAIETQKMETVKGLLLSDRTPLGGAAGYLSLLPADSQSALMEGTWQAAEEIENPTERIKQQQAIVARAGTVPLSALNSARAAAESTVHTGETELQANLVTGMDAQALGKFKAGGADPDLFKAYLSIRRANPELDAATAWTSAKQGFDLKKNRDPLSKANEEALIGAFDTANTNKAFGIRSGFLFGKTATTGTGAITPWLRAAWNDAPGMSNDKAASSIGYAEEKGVRFAGGVAFIKADAKPGSKEWHDPSYFPGMSGGAKRDMLILGFKNEYELQAGRDKQFDPDNIVSIFQQPDTGGKLAFSVVYAVTGNDGIPRMRNFFIGQEAIAAQAGKAIDTRDQKTRNMAAPASETMYQKQDSSTLPKSIYSKP